MSAEQKEQRRLQRERKKAMLAAVQHSEFGGKVLTDTELEAVIQRGGDKKR